MPNVAHVLVAQEKNLGGVNCKTATGINGGGLVLLGGGRSAAHR